MPTDATGLIGTSDYKLSTLTLITSDGGVQDIKGLMLELNLYEDIFSPAMTGSLMLGDALDLPTTFTMHGNEFLVVTLDKPSLNAPIIKTFRIYKISDRTQSANALQNYTIYFCSEELFLSTQILVSKSYKGKRIDQMIADLLLGKLRTNPSKVFNIEQTAGIFDIIIPRMSPMEAIQWLVPRAYNVNKNLFFFFENRDGYSLASYETLVQQPPYNTYTYDITLKPDPEHNSNTFVLMNIIEDFNIIKSMKSGAYSSTLLSLDIVSRKFSTLNFNASQLKQNAILNANIPVNGFPNRFGQALSDPTENMLKYVITTDADKSRNPIAYYKWLPQTASRLGMLNTFKVVGSIPGDVNLKVGMVINVQIPKGEIQDKKSSNERFRSGNFLISSVHHRFIMDIMTTVVELLSDSTSVPAHPAVGGSPTLQNVVRQ